MICLSAWCNPKLACTPTIQSSTTLGLMLTPSGKIYNKISDMLSSGWRRSNRLILNQRKIKGILFRTRQLLQTSSDLVLQIQGEDIKRVTKFNYLGVILDEKLHWKERTDSNCNKVNKQLGLLARIRSCLTLKPVKCVCNTLIEPILCYTDTEFGELSATSSKTLQRLQNRAARIVLRRDSCKDTFNVLRWTKLETKRKRHKCVLVYKCLNNLVPI